MGEITRFAPSPTGYLHLGHAYSARFGFDAARKSGGKFLLRIEDIDHSRCREEFVSAIFEDLAWLGLTWEPDVWRQSDRLPHYFQALETLNAMGLVYPCFCTRKEIQLEIERMGGAPHELENSVYPGTCRSLTKDTREEKIAHGGDYAIRLNVAKATEVTGPLRWRDREKGEQLADPERLGDVVLARKDIATSYHLAVVVDDAAQSVTLVTRGQDLWESTHVHRLLQELLGLPVPEWWHHKLLTNEKGKRFAKRDQSQTLRWYRESGKCIPESLL